MQYPTVGQRSRSGQTGVGHRPVVVENHIQTGQSCHDDCIRKVPPQRGVLGFLLNPIIPRREALFAPFTPTSSTHQAAETVDPGLGETPRKPDVVDLYSQFPGVLPGGDHRSRRLSRPGDGGRRSSTPNDAGVWLQYILDEAWANAETGSLDSGPVLAFAYGYLAHAAGDVFAHTMVNEFAGGPFPPLAEGGGLTDPENIKNALRHIVVEGYIADATLGFDGDPSPETLPGGDVSDDSHTRDRHLRFRSSS